LYLEKKAEDEPFTRVLLSFSKWGQRNSGISFGNPTPTLLEYSDRPRMASIVGLVSSVKAVMLSHSADPTAKKMAGNIYVNLQAHLEGVNTTSTGGFGRDLTNDRVGGTGISFFSSSVSSCLGKSETHTFYIPTLTTDETRAELETKLLKIRGVLSFLLDIRTRRATIRSFIASKELQLALKQNGITNAHLVNEGMESLGKENVPEYLPDEVDSSSASWYSSIVSWGTSTVEERKEKQRRTEKKKEFQTNRNFFSKLYSVGEALNIFKYNHHITSSTNERNVVMYRINVSVLLQQLISIW